MESAEILIPPTLLSRMEVLNLSSQSGIAQFASDASRNYPDILDFLSFLDMRCLFLTLSNDPRNCHCLQENKTMKKKEKKGFLIPTAPWCWWAAPVPAGDGSCDCQQLRYPGLGPALRCFKLSRICWKWGEQEVQCSKPGCRQCLGLEFGGEEVTFFLEFHSWTRGKRFFVLLCLSDKDSGSMCLKRCTCFGVCCLVALAAAVA